jgi:hypothetical protein
VHRQSKKVKELEAQLAAERQAKVDAEAKLQAATEEKLKADAEDKKKAEAEKKKKAEAEKKRKAEAKKKKKELAKLLKRTKTLEEERGELEMAKKQAEAFRHFEINMAFFFAMAGADQAGDYPVGGYASARGYLDITDFFMLFLSFGPHVLSLEDGTPAYGVFGDIGARFQIALVTLEGFYRPNFKVAKIYENGEGFSNAGGAAIGLQFGHFNLRWEFVGDQYMPLANGPYWWTGPVLGYKPIPEKPSTLAKKRQQRSEAKKNSNHLAEARRKRALELAAIQERLNELNAAEQAEVDNAGAEADVIDGENAEAEPDTP